MKIVFDATNQRQGGGLQVALGTVEVLPKMGDSVNPLVLALKNSPIEARCKDVGIPVLTLEAGRRARIMRQLQKVSLPDDEESGVIYTIFGPPLRASKRTVTVSGVAYSNLFYPEVDFWRREPHLKRFMRRARDHFRLRGILKADGLIFETDALRRRALDQHPSRLSERTTTVIPPAVTPFASEPRSNEVLEQTLAGLPRKPRILLAASWHPNKNLDSVPAIASAMKALGTDAVFVFTLEPESIGGIQLRSLAESLGVSDAIYFIGRVPQESIGLALRAVDTVLLLSELESFSNNVIEAFGSHRPLVISDRDWARSACGEAALYVNEASPRSVALALIRSFDAQIRDQLVEEGIRHLSSNYPTQEERLRSVMTFLAQVSREVSSA